MIGSALSVLTAMLAGAVFGGAYLALLWVAVRCLPKDRSGVLVFAVLGIARVALLLGAVAAAAVFEVKAEGLVAALAGFVAVRLAAARLIGPGEKEDTVWK